MSKLGHVTEQYFLNKGLPKDSAEINTLRYNAWIDDGAKGYPPGIVYVNVDMTQDAIQKQILVITNDVRLDQEKQLRAYEVAAELAFEKRSAAFLDYPLAYANLIQGVDTKNLGQKIKDNPYAAWDDLVTVDAVSGNVNDWIKGNDTSGSKSGVYNNSLSGAIINVATTADNLGESGANLIGAAANISNTIKDITNKVNDFTKPLGDTGISGVLLIGIGLLGVLFFSK